MVSDSGRSRRRHDRDTSQLLSTTPRRHALNDVSFEIRCGEIFGVLGPNGSGKTTLFRILSTLLRPDSGRVTIFGYDLVTQPHEVRQQLGVVFQMPSLDVKLSAQENLMHQGRLYGLRGCDLRERTIRLLDQVGLGDQPDTRVQVFSGGMRRRVELAKALLHQPPLLLLDEPATGLDVRARRDLWGHLEQLREAQGVTIAVTTHLMDEADRCDRLAIVNQGKLVAIDTPDRLKARIGGHVIAVEPANDQPQALAQEITRRFGPWEEAARPVAIDGKIFFEKADGPSFVATLAGAFPGQINSMTVGQPTLEDVYMHLTGAAL